MVRASGARRARDERRSHVVTAGGGIRGASEACLSGSLLIAWFAAWTALRDLLPAFELRAYWGGLLLVLPFLYAACVNATACGRRLAAPRAVILAAIVIAVIAPLSRGEIPLTGWGLFTVISSGLYLGRRHFAVAVALVLTSVAGALAVGGATGASGLSMGSLGIGTLSLAFVAAREAPRRVGHRLPATAIVLESRWGVFRRFAEGLGAVTLTLAFAVLLAFFLETVGDFARERLALVGRDPVRASARPGSSTKALSSLVVFPRDGIGDTARADTVPVPLFEVRVESRRELPGSVFRLPVTTVEGFLPPERRQFRVISRDQVRAWTVIRDTVHAPDAAVVRVSGRRVAFGKTHDETLIAGGPVATAVRLDRGGEAVVALRLYEQGAVTAEGRSKRRLDYSVLVDEEVLARCFAAGDRDRWQGPGLGRAFHPDPRHLFLPPQCPGLAVMDVLANEIASKGGEDHEQIDAIRRALAERYGYLRGAPFGGFESALTELEDQREGTCTHFAVAALALARRMGFPARLVLGYLVDERDEDEDVWRVTTRDQHAWIEVHFEELGWVPVDPTPPGSASSESGSRGPLAGSVGTDGTTPHLLRRTIESVVGPLGTQPLFWGALGAFASIWILGRVLRSRERLAGSSPPRRRHEEDLYRRTLSALATLGLNRERGQTPLEFAHLAASRDSRLAPLIVHTERLYAVWFGGQPLGSGDRDRIIRFVEEIEEVAQRWRIGR